MNTSQTLETGPEINEDYANRMSDLFTRVMAANAIMKVAYKDIVYTIILKYLDTGVLTKADMIRLNKISKILNE